MCVLKFDVRLKHECWDSDAYGWVEWRKKILIFPFFSALCYISVSDSVSVLVISFFTLLFIFSFCVLGFFFLLSSASLSFHLPCMFCFRFYIWNQSWIKCIEQKKSKKKRKSSRTTKHIQCVYSSSYRIRAHRKHTQISFHCLR